MKETEKKEVNKKAMVQVEAKVQLKIKMKAAIVQVRWMNMGKSICRGDKDRTAAAAALRQ